MPIPPVTIDAVISADGTRIGYRQMGAGPGIVVLHGAWRASQHYLRLAEALSGQFTVTIPDRRGRGLSGPVRDVQGEYSLEKECEDLAALLHETGARFVFGHSFGGLVALESAQALSIDRLAVYEPAVFIRHSLPTGWIPEFERALAREQTAWAMAIFFKGMQMGGGSRYPRWALWPVIALLSRSELGKVLTGLLPTLPREFHAGVQADTTYAKYRGVLAETLILGGDQSPAYLRNALPVLQASIARARLVELPGLDHNDPDNSAPDQVAAQLIPFFFRCGKGIILKNLDTDLRRGSHG